MLKSRPDGPRKTVYTPISAEGNILLSSAAFLCSLEQKSQPSERTILQPGIAHFRCGTLLRYGNDCELFNKGTEWHIRHFLQLGGE